MKKKNKQLVVGVTGHRPSKLGTEDCYSDETLKKLTKLAYRNLKQLQPSKVITGMALGWDTGVAIADRRRASASQPCY